MKNKNLTSLEEFKEKNYGKRGTKERKELEEKVGTTKSYISKIENNIKEARISTLQKIVELGFGGQLELSIKI